MKQREENNMNTFEFTYVTYIASTPAKIFKALIDAKMTKKYWQHENVSDWKPGSRWEHRSTDKGGGVDMTGRVIEFTPSRRLVLSWFLPADEAREDRHSKVTLEVEPYHHVTRLTVRHEGLEPGSEMQKGIAEGWPIVCASLKTLLETGKALPQLWDKAA
jgi:uncharacterized protein YndB with AHSA1/START domain